MAHRGRLNVLTHVLGKPYAAIIAEFEGEEVASRAATSRRSDVGDDWTGDVKYHLGARLLRGQHGEMVEVPMVLAPNPSHLEFVNPVVEGMARASQDVTDKPRRAGDATTRRVWRSLIHGDAAFPGQGIVAETLNLSALPGYTTGGTIHIIVNNQVGFTTDPSTRARPSTPAISPRDSRSRSSTSTPTIRRPASRRPGWRSPTASSSARTS